jgi:hypothetical protein
MPCLGSPRVTLRKTAVHILQIYLRCLPAPGHPSPLRRFSSDVQAVLRCIVTLGLDSADRRVVHETLIRWRLLSGGSGSVYCPGPAELN